MVWLPTWHQAKLICRNLNISQREINTAICSPGAAGLGDDTAALYTLIMKKLQNL